MKTSVILDNKEGIFSGHYDGRHNQLLITYNSDTYPQTDDVEGSLTIRCDEYSLKNLEKLIASFRFELYGPKELPK